MEGFVSAELIEGLNLTSAAWTLVIMSEGYTSDQLELFKDQASAFTRVLRNTAPFGDCWSGIRIWRIDVASIDSGMTTTSDCRVGAVPDHEANTFFGATDCKNGKKGLFCDWNKAIAMTSQNPIRVRYDAILLFVNAAEAEGWGMTSRGKKVSIAGTGPGAADIMIHELGHIFNLADEYFSENSCSGPEPSRDRYPGNDDFLQAAPNVDTIADKINPKSKWGILVLDAIKPFPNPDLTCATCPPNQRITFPSGPWDPANLVGWFEGAGRYHCGLYRPQFNCKMRDAETPSLTERAPEFCIICQEHIRDVLIPFVKAANIQAP